MECGGLRPNKPSPGAHVNLLICVLEASYRKVFGSGCSISHSTASSPSDHGMIDITALVTSVHSVQHGFTSCRADYFVKPGSPKCQI